MFKRIINLSLVCLLLACSKGEDSKTTPEETKPNPEPTEKYTFLENEVRPASSLACFAGAYYRKVVSSKDTWIGISGEVTLPTIKFDEIRFNPAKPKQYLDNPSVYMGGSMDGQETDIGLTWEVIRHENGAVSEERVAFRPFLRRASHKSGQASLYVNAPAQKEYYWYPGEKVEMSVEVISNGVLKLSIKGAGKSYETTFEAAGYTLTGVGEFKRVNAIDQVSNEGKPAQYTEAVVSNSKWSYTNLIRRQKGERVVVPMHNGRMTSMLCPATKHFSIEQNEEEAKVGAETISISGKGF
ncbi:hypothetical protein [Sphingobacterium sp. SGL-16]|uniref:hypothetical protein n=1 Tax=Sphingobacterium sp. SGL-16 TaxID=2710883 RepID=UPI0019CF90C3|nr:hypothetical protein [Sphingobacterium sp. SGL-16]